MRDLNLREGLVLAPLLVLIVAMGVYPKPVIERMEPAVDALVAHVETHVDGFHEPTSRFGADIQAGDGEAADDAGDDH
jgi:NADH-quinone oxidoreductase subunit M